MANKTLLNGVNEVLKKAKMIQGDSGSLTSLTDSPRQIWVDSSIQAWNESIEELYMTTGEPLPEVLAEATITLANGDRDYALNTYNILYWPFLDETNGQYIYEFNGSYLDLVNSQTVPADYTGMPLYGVIRPTDGQVYLDRIPSASEVGLVYKYRYMKDFSLSTAAATFPFKDSVFRAMVPAVAEMFNYIHKHEFNVDLFRLNIARAARLVTGRTPVTSYGRAGSNVDGGIFFPYE